MNKKLALTLAWTLVLVGVAIALFKTYAQFDTLTAMYYRDGTLNKVFENIFKIKGYTLINFSLIGGYIIKLVEIWSNKDGK